jgi:hypothetical protein
MKKRRIPCMNKDLPGALIDKKRPGGFAIDKNAPAI